MKQVAVPLLTFALGIAVCWLYRDSRVQHDYQTATWAPPQYMIMWRTQNPASDPIAHRLKLISYREGESNVRLRPDPDDATAILTFTDDAGRASKYEHLTP